MEVKSGNSINQANPSHVHANWGFERPGRYSMQVQATTDDAKSEVKTYTWVVGKSAEDDQADEPAEGATPCGSEDEASDGATSGDLAGTGARNKAGSAGIAGAAGKSSAVGKSRSSSSTASSTGSTSSTGAQGSATCKKGEPALRPQIKDDRTQPPKWTNPSALNFGLGSAAKLSLIHI